MAGWLPLSILAWWYGTNLHNAATEMLAPAGLSIPAANHTPPTIGDNRWWHGKDDAVIGDAPDNLFYFMHISDLHVSRYHTVGGVAHLMHFLKTTLPLVSPSFVLVTGDLTDAKSEVHKLGVQFEDEWQTYHRLLQEAGVLDKAGGGFWRDLRGNHDCFSVPGWQHRNNYYRQYGASPNETGWSFVAEQSYGRYAFVALDGCPRPGPARLYNFFGYLDTTNMDTLAERLDHSRDNVNHTIMLSHYPITTTVFGSTSDGRTFDELSRDISAYLCGHLHRLAGGLGDMLQGYRPAGFMELELPDLKLTASYRVMAIDHDLVSMADRQLELSEIPLPIASAELPTIAESTSPVVLITNPKDARYITPRHEPVARIRRSTHIRALVFSEAKPQQTKVYVDGELLGPLRYSGKGSRSDAPGQFVPLWTTAWQPTDYDDGQPHHLRVVVTDANGRTGTDEVVFRVDGSREQLDTGMSSWIIDSNMPRLFKCWYLGVYALVCLSLLLPQLYLCIRAWCGTADRWRKESVLHVRRCEQQLVITSGLVHVALLARLYTARWRHRLLALAEHHLVWSVIYGHFLWLAAMPLSPATLFAHSESHIGWIYLYGVWADGQWIPVLDTWAMPAVQLGCFELWVLLYVALAAGDADLYDDASHPTKATKQVGSLARGVLIRLCVAWCLFVQTFWTITSWRIGGWPMIIGGVGLTWWILAQAVLFWHFGFSNLLQQHSAEADYLHGDGSTVESRKDH